MFFYVYTVRNLHHMGNERFSVVLRGNKIDIGMEQNGQLWRGFFDTLIYSHQRYYTDPCIVFALTKH